MQDQLLYEYAVIRIVPRVEREEFLNVGVVLYCASRKFLQTRYVLNEARITAFSCKTDLAEIARYLEAFERICAANPDGGPISRLPAAERFRWLTATRSTVVQASKVHPGFCTGPEEKLEQLFRELVLE